MKKKFLGIIAVFLLSVFIIPSKVFATESKIFTVNVPNKAKLPNDFMYSMTAREYATTHIIGENIDSILQNTQQDDGTRIFSYVEGKSEESTIEITDQMRIFSKIRFGEDVLDEYDKIAIKLVAPKETSDDTNFVVDFKEAREKEFWDLPYVTAFFPAILADVLEGWNDSKIIKANLIIEWKLMNANNKVLGIDKEIISEDEEDVDYQFEVSKDLTAADNIVYEITDEDKAEFAAYLEEEGEETEVDYNTVEKYVIKFVDADYPTDGTYYIYDYNENYDILEHDEFEYFFNLKVYEKKLMTWKAVIKNKEGKELIYIDESNWPKFTLAPGVTDKDNIELEIPDEDGFIEIVQNGFGIEPSKLSMLFPEYKNYKVLDGAKQKYDLASKKALSFRFDIPFETFKRSGKVYMDGKLVNAKNYRSTSGSTIITFNDDYTRTLSQGNHTLRVTTDDGEGTTTFTITDSINNPNTIDNISMYIGLFMMSVLSIGTILSLRKKVNN